MSVYFNRYFEQSQILKPRGCRTAVGMAPQELAAPADMGCMAAGGPRGPAACGGQRDRAQGSSLSLVSSQRCFPLLCSERQRQAAESPGILHQRPSCTAADLLMYAGAQGDRVGAISPMDKGATQHQMTPYVTISLPSPLLSLCPRAKGAQSPREGCSSRAGDLPDLWSHSCRAGELCILAFWLNRALQ